MIDQFATSDQYNWIVAQLESLPTELAVLSPSEWAEQNRYLPPSVTPQPGYYRFDVAPHLREIVDCLGVESPVQFVAVQKGAQVGATVGILENYVGYLIAHVRNAPAMLLTADAELAALRLDEYIIPMLQTSGLMECIRSTDEGNNRKTGKTNKKLEWYGGGFLVPLGAKNASKLVSLSILALLRDEIDKYDDTVGSKHEDPLKLSEARTNAYSARRKILDLSTPTIKGQSKIERRYELGDQRHRFIACLKCGHRQTLRWTRTDNKTGEVTGFSWETVDGRLVPGSVRYLCEQCAHPHREEDKARLFANAEWVPTAVPSTPHYRSYKLPALYSMLFTWESCALSWIEAWNDEANRPRDLQKLQDFYNNILGETYELRGEKLRFESVSSHRRSAYKYGEIPNAFATEFCEGPILLLVCTVDVHKDNLSVAVVGWTAGRRAFLIEYRKLEGDTEQLDDPETWVKLREIIEQGQWTADDGKQYGITITLIDSGYRTDHVYQFCADYVSAVFPLKGRDEPPKSATIKQFWVSKTPDGQQMIGVTVDYYKDRWSAALKNGWSGIDQQRHGHFNAPLDATDKQLKELTVEVKREKIEKATGKRIGWEWYRPANAANELWDLLVYAYCALEVVAWDYCLHQLELENINWGDFYKHALKSPDTDEPMFFRSAESS